jgi:hypothetical protein
MSVIRIRVACKKGLFLFYKSFALATLNPKH